MLYSLFSWHMYLTCSLASSLIAWISAPVPSPLSPLSCPSYLMWHPRLMVPYPWNLYFSPPQTKIWQYNLYKFFLNWHSPVSKIVSSREARALSNILVLYTQPAEQLLVWSLLSVIICWVNQWISFTFYPLS